jgi:WD40 repeat protein/DNA-binding SARP family transcriptional activator
VLEIRLLGQFDLSLAGATLDLPSRPAQSLLAYLVLNAGVAHRREKLAGLLWPEATEANARSYLRKALWQLRKTLPPGDIPGRDYWRVDEIAIGFNPQSEYWLDAAELERKSDGTEPLEADRRAAAAYRGELLPGFYDEWAVLERERLAARFEQRIGRLLDGLVAAQGWPDVLEWGERWIALGGAPEPAFQALMVAHSGRGDLAAAVAVFQRCQEALERELGVEPSEQTRALYEQLRGGAGDAALASAATKLATVPSPAESAEKLPVPGDPPFKGLQCFEPADSGRFFGREHLTDQFVERLRQHPFLAIVGASGSGKSSLVRAGLVPALLDSLAGNHVYLLSPGAHPLEAVAACLGRGADVANLAHELERDPNTLLVHLRRHAKEGAPPIFVADQFEELFTLCHAETERQAFVDNLLLAALSPSAPARVVITLRADFYAHCAQYPELRAALAEHQAFIGPMSAAELRRAIEAPATLDGWSFEPGLVDWVLREAGDEPGGLPLVSHALLETWQRRRGRTLTYQGYAASGGVQGAIAKTAETVYHHGLTARQQPLARGIFLRLTELGEGTQDTRRQATLAELVPRPELAGEVAAVVGILADARLITTAEGTIEVAHEALIREWPALRQWLAEDRDGLRLGRRLSEAAQEWDALDRDPGALYRGSRLAQALEWADAHPDELNVRDREFLIVSRARAEDEAADAAARQQRELEASYRLAEAEKLRADESARSAVQLRQRAIYLSGLVVVALILATAAAWLGGQARQAATVAQSNERVAFARELAAAAMNNLDVDPERSLLLAWQAVDATYSVDRSVSTEAEDALHVALLASRVEQTLSLRPDEAVAVAFSPDGVRLAATSSRGVVTIWNTADGQAVITLDTQAGSAAHALVFSPDGSRLVTTGVANTAVVWDLSSGQPLLSLADHTDVVQAVAFSADGTRLATASADGSAKLWDARTGQEQAKLTAGAGPLVALAFSSDGTRLAAASRDGTLNVWQVAANRPLHLYSEAGATALSFSPDGNRLVGIAVTSLTIWDGWTGQVIQTLALTGHTGQITAVAFSLDGTRLATGSVDRHAIVWDLSTGQPLLTLAGHAGTIGGVAFSADGGRLATGSADGTAQVWNVGLSHELYSQSTLAAANGRLTQSADGKLLAVAYGPDGAAAIFDALTGQVQEVLTSTAGIRALAFDPAGVQLATAGEDLIDLWDVASGRNVASLPAALGQINALEFSHDGTRIASAGESGNVQVWRLADNQASFVLHNSAPLWALAFSPEDRRLAFAARDGTTRIADTATGAVALTLTSPSGVRAVAFSPDGTLLATATDGGLTQIWSLTQTSGQVQVTLSGHSSQVMDVIFSSDGKRVATAGRDGTAKLWDAATGQLLLTLWGGGRGLRGVVLDPDGSRLITSGDDGLRAYLLQINDLAALAATRVTRSLTQAECQQYLHSATCPAER